MPLSWSALEAFLILSETRSFSSAAAKLRVTQPNISKLIKGLEDQLSSPLFIRGRKGVELTAAGKALEERVAPRFQEIVEAITDTREGKSALRGRIRIGCLPEVGAAYFFPRVLEFQRLFPEIHIDMKYCTQDITLAELESGNLDYGIVAVKSPQGTLRSWALHEEEIVLAGSVERIKELRNGSYKRKPAPFVAYRPDDQLVSSFIQMHQRKLPLDEIKEVLCVNSQRSMVEAMQAGIGFAVIPRLSLSAYGKPTSALAEFPGLVRTDPIFLVGLEQPKSFQPLRLIKFREHLLKA